MGLKNVLENVINNISMSQQETKEIEKNAKKIIALLKKSGLNADIGGSLAKGTMIKKKNQDVDIFVTLSKEQIEKFEKLVGKTKLDFEVVHGSRDYLKVIGGETVFELIPVLKLTLIRNAPKGVLSVESKAENVTDFSLIHVKYIKKMISKNKKLANEIRLAKAFCHAQNVYGAESYIGGFSGYALEVLVCYYGSFEKFLKNVEKDKVIDPEKQFKNKNEIFRELNQSKLQSPIILIDPTYKLRNVCAGLMKEAFEKFLESAKKFLKSPSEDYFNKIEFNLNDFLEMAKKEKLAVYKLDIMTDRQEGDIAGTKMKKFFRYIISELKRKEQNVVYSEFIYSGEKNAVGYLAISEKNMIEIVGPKEDMKDAVKSFKKVRGKVYVSKGFVCAQEQVLVSEIFRRQTYPAEGMSVGFEWEKINF